jgi:hypothetical protein
MAMGLSGSFQTLLYTARLEVKALLRMYRSRQKLSAMEGVLCRST